MAPSATLTVGVHWPSTTEELPRKVFQNLLSPLTSEIDNGLRLIGSHVQLQPVPLGSLHRDLRGECNPRKQFGGCVADAWQKEIIRVGGRLYVDLFELVGGSVHLPCLEQDRGQQILLPEPLYQLSVKPSESEGEHDICSRIPSSNSRSPWRGAHVCRHFAL